MNQIQKLTGIAIATAAASLFSLATSAAPAPDTATVKCEGVNACKGQNDCAGAKNSCAGQGACKGTGYKFLTKAECEKARDEIKKN